MQIYENNLKKKQRSTEKQQFLHNLCYTGPTFHICATSIRKIIAAQANVSLFCSYLRLLVLQDTNKNDKTHNCNYTYYVPVTPDMIGKTIEAYVMLADGDPTAAAPETIKPEVYITAYPTPFKKKTLKITK